MEKVYRLLDWLDMEQAVDWLQDMTSTRANSTSLLQLCDAGQCLVYWDCRGVGGDVSIDIGEEEPMYVPATGAGICKVEYPLQLGDISRHGTHVIGLVRMKETGKLIENTDLWVPIENAVRPPLFKPADIQALAAKMNGEPSPLNAAELNELELERAARESAEAEVLELRKWIGDRTLSNMRAMLKDDLPLRAMTERAETAEKMVAAMDRELKELRELRQRDAGLFEKMTERLGAYQKGEPPITKTETPVPAPGLTFSRPSNALIVAHAASCKFWRNFDPERPPLQKQVTAFMIERGVPARQAAELAIAIKPDDLPKS